MNTKSYTILYIVLVLIIPIVSWCEVRLPQFFRDSMVLQRDSNIKIWGWADEGESITVQLANLKSSLKVGKTKTWSTSLSPLQAGGPYELIVTGTNTIRLKEVLIGDVWFCAGQSNMVLTMERVKEKYADEIASADFPMIRYLFVPVQTNLQGKQDDIMECHWKAANSRDILQISATAYFFAKSMHQKNKVPIGLINSSVGGTPIEAWISESGLSSFKDQSNLIQKNKDTAYTNPIKRNTDERNKRNAQKPVIDLGLIGSTKWYEANYLPKGWKPINIPGYWEDQGIKDLNGVVWYRKEIQIPESMTGKAAKLFMGRIVDADYIYVNGKLIGNITYQYPPRRYEIPAGVLKPRNNTFVIRVINQSGKGGFVPDKPYYLTAGGQNIDLKGEWMYKVGEVYEPVIETDPITNLVHQNQPSALFNAMISPFTSFGIKGFVWYQGESNAGKPQEYVQFLPALIRDWRNQWKNDDLPFVYAQLPNFMDANYLPSESQWAILREAQLKALSVPQTAMSVNIDLGEWNDIHPLNKKQVGERLALAALSLTDAKKDQVYSGPIFKSATILNDKISIVFNHTGSGLMTKDGEPLSYFSIAGEDKKFVWAKAEISGDQVIVWNDTIKSPKYVRYAWADNPDNANLINNEGLPASPFRTDH